MAYTTINKSTDHFNTVNWTGTSSSPVNVTGFGHNPDIIWNKYAGGSGDHQLYDVVRTATKMIVPNSQNAESTNSNGVTAFISDGFTAGSDINVNGGASVAWGWKAGGGQGSSNTDGSINTTYTSVNTTAGISISKYTGTGANATVGHGLSSAPRLIIFKNLDTATAWDVFFHNVGQGRRLFLDQSVSFNTSTNYMNDTYPTSTVFSVGNADNTNKSGSPMIAYCFTDVVGFSRISAWTGNSDANNGPFVYTGFRPAFILSKNQNRNENWLIHDNKNDTLNPVTKKLSPNDNSAQSDNTAFSIDFLSNGFKIRTADTALNQSDELYAYAAFAEAPLVGSNNICTTSR